MRDVPETATSMTDTDRTLCAATAGLLRASGSIAVWSMALSLIAGLVLSLTGRSLPSASWGAYAVVGLAGLVERCFALRLRQEAALFEGLAQGAIDGLGALDSTLETLGLRRHGEASRKLPERVLAARQTMQRHVFAVVVQTAAFAIALALAELR